MLREKDFQSKVLEIVSQIPAGKVMTYGAIAELAGLRSGARMVGYILNAQKYSDKYPCHRVVNRNGELSGKNYFPTPTMMRELLEAEGISFENEKVVMKLHNWKIID